MALEFNSKPIPGTTLGIMAGSPEVQFRRLQFWETAGEAEIIGKPGGRFVQVEHILHNRCGKYSDLMKRLDTLDALIGRNGTLEFASGSGNALVREKFANCTFERYEKVPTGGQSVAMPLKDLSGTLYDENSYPDGGWFITLQLSFRQLLV